MKFYWTILCLIAFVAPIYSFAESIVSASWIHRGEMLALQISDQPTSLPFTAGKIWELLESSDLDQIKTKNFALSCDGVITVAGVPFGGCDIFVSADVVNFKKESVEFCLKSEEANQVLSRLKNSESLVSLKIQTSIEPTDKTNTFAFELNWKKKTVCGSIDKNLVTEP